jgi:hypothetical protein
MEPGRSHPRVALDWKLSTAAPRRVVSGFTAATSSAAMGVRSCPVTDGSPGKNARPSRHDRTLAADRRVGRCASLITITE